MSHQLERLLLSLSFTNAQSIATVGSFANNIAAAFEIKTLTTCSKKNFDAVRQDGPKDVFDYNDKDMVSQVMKQYPDLSYIFDTIGSPASSDSVTKIFGERKGTLCTVRPGKAHTEGMDDNISVHDVFVFTVFPKEHDYRGKFQWPVSVLLFYPLPSVQKGQPYLTAC